MDISTLSRKKTTLAPNVLTYAKVLSTTGHSYKSIELYDEMMNAIGYTVQSVLEKALDHDRVIVGLSEAVKALTRNPEDALFCVLAQPKRGDSATHMQEILLEAYCNENLIYVLKVDDPEKLSRTIGSMKIESCVLIQRFDGEKPFELEDRLVDHCEEYWNAQHQPIIRLPDE